MKERKVKGVSFRVQDRMSVASVSRACGRRDAVSTGVFKRGKEDGKIGGCISELHASVSMSFGRIKKSRTEGEEEKVGGFESRFAPMLTFWLPDESARSQ